MCGSEYQVFSIPWKYEDIIPHYNRFIIHTTPSLFTFVTSPMVNTKISEGRSGTLGWSVLATKSVSRSSSFLVLNLDIWFLIPIYIILARIILPLVTFLNHDSLVVLFDLHEIKLFVSLIKCVGQRGKFRMYGDLRSSYGT